MPCRYESQTHCLITVDIALDTKYLAVEASKFIFEGNVARAVTPLAYKAFIEYIPNLNCFTTKNIIKAVKLPLGVPVYINGYDCSDTKLAYSVDMDKVILVLNKLRNWIELNYDTYPVLWGDEELVDVSWDFCVGA